MRTLARREPLRVLTEVEYAQMRLETVCKEGQKVPGMTPYQAGVVGQRIGMAVRRRNEALARERALPARQRRALR